MTDLIRDLPEDDRPREKLVERGVENLSNSDLVAVLLGCGTRGTNAIQLAREILKGGIENLARLDIDQLSQVRGIGIAKAARIAASFELARRCGRKPPPKEFKLVEFAEKVMHLHGHRKQERLGAAILDGSHQIRGMREIFVGTVTYTVVSTREIIQFAMMHDAKALVLYHNHPSGRTIPSFEDITFTKKMKDALNLCDIDLVDHIIVGRKTYTTMKGEYY